MTAMAPNPNAGEVWSSRLRRLYGRGTGTGRVVIDAVVGDRVDFTYRSTGVPNSTTIQAFQLNYEFAAASVLDVEAVSA